MTPLDRPICFLDTETTSLHPDREIWEFAAIRREGSGEESTTQFFIDVDLSQADPFALTIGGYYQRHPMGKRLSGDQYVNPATWLGTSLSKVEAARRMATVTHGATIVGAVPNFDTEGIADLLRAYGIAPAWHYHLCDVENLMVGALRAKVTYGPDLDEDEIDRLFIVTKPPWHSEWLSEALGIRLPTDEERHTALGDAQWAMRCYDAVMGE